MNSFFPKFLEIVFEEKRKKNNKFIVKIDNTIETIKKCTYLFICKRTKNK